MSEPHAFTDDDFAQRAPIHPDSLPDYRIWHDLLRKWNARINLVAPKTLDAFWWRHALDSAQIVPLLPDAARTIVDFGSGAGFPGLSIAIEAKHAHPDRAVHLIESAGKKANFLKTVSRETHCETVSVHAERIEAIDSLSADIVTARAFAPLMRLFPLAHRHLNEQGQLLLLKGSSVREEITEAAQDWDFDYTLTQSMTDEAGFIVDIRYLRRK